MAPPNCQLVVGARVNQWLVLAKLGEGGFGAVYKVQEQSTGKHYAIKLEALGGNFTGATLLMEIQVLRMLGELGSTYFCKVIDNGSEPNRFMFVVMTLVGRSLHDIRKAYTAQKFNLHTALCSGVQCLRAIRDLHRVKYLHRDIKPGNYSIGRAEDRDARTIYLLDFGMCRKYVNDTGNIRRPRIGAAFRGTIRYAPLACHRNEEYARKDDVESWLYQQIECTKAACPWRALSDMKAIGDWKESCRKVPEKRRELLEDMPIEFDAIYGHIIKLQYYDEPQYEWIEKLMWQALRKSGTQESDLYEWEEVPAAGPVPPPRPVPPPQRPTALRPAQSTMQNMNMNPWMRSTYTPASPSRMMFPTGVAGRGQPVRSTRQVPTAKASTSCRPMPMPIRPRAPNANASKR